MALIQTRTYHYIQSGGSAINMTTNLSGIIRKQLDELAVDLMSTHFVTNIMMKLVGEPPHHLRQSFTRDLKNTSLKSCGDTTRGYFNCHNVMRVIYFKGNNFSFANLTINTYEVFIDKFIGCFEVSESDIRHNNITKTEHCSRECSTFLYYGIIEDVCHCISNLTSLIPVRITSCVESCRGNKYQICGRHSSVAVHSKILAPKNYHPRSYSSSCIFMRNCTHEVNGRAGVNLEIVDCSEDNGGCGDAECQTTIFRVETEKPYNVTISTCACKSGYLTDNYLKCIDIDECKSESACDSSANCTNTQGSYFCNCKDGFKEDNSTGRVICNDIDECLNETTTLCDKTSTTCFNKIGGYECNCSVGFMNYDKALKKCSDIDECLEIPCIDVSATICNNTVGSFYCKCTRGYEDMSPDATPSPSTTCTDINECSRDHDCSESTTTCNNTQGSYECICREGYKERNRTHCEDKDECADRTCDELSTSCINIIGSYKCLCLYGFVKYENNTDKCQDTDECGSETTCDARTTTCQNIPGSYACNCLVGLKYVTRQRCEDIDECSSLKHHCGKLSTCINTIGSFDCSCPDNTLKSVYHHSIECQDIDECEEMNKCNRTVSFCLNMLSSYMCQCMPGYINLDNYTCASKSIEGFENTTFYIDDDDFTTEEFAIDIADILKEYIIGLIVIGSIFSLIFAAVFVKCMFRCLGRAKLDISSTLSGGSIIRPRA